MIYEGNLNITKDKKIAVINGRFNHLVTDRLVEGARDSFLRHGGDEKNLDIVLVPGAFEIPMALKKILQTKKYDGVVCVGAVIRGSTPHFDYVAAETTKGIASLSLQYDVPVSNGVLTTDNLDQALDRAGVKVGNKGFEAMTSTIEMINLYHAIDN
jgi:6,7-dimethyl-8-ribityllumazine synthase